MSEYTQMLEGFQSNIDYSSDDYFGQLMESVRAFRRFDEALDSFIVERGYSGQTDDIDDKVSFIRNSFKAAGVPEPRNIHSWYTKRVEPKRSTAFQLAFAFGLNVEETDDFFTRVFLDRSFDFHSYNELIYYFCIKQGLTYADAAAAIKEIDGQYSIKRGAVGSEDIKYTGAIFTDISGMNSIEELKKYICGNVHQFEYNNATATKTIRTLWAWISDLAAREYDVRINIGREDDTDEKLSSGMISDMDIFQIIIGIGKDTLKDFSPDGRSLSPVLNENNLIHSLAARSFPSRQGINKIINGQPAENETVRKTLILLKFYDFWAERAVSNSSDIYKGGADNAARCIDEINNCLIDANYPELYPGNPYDWIFMWTCRDEEPLWSFWYYISEVIENKREMIGEEE